MVEMVRSGKLTILPIPHAHSFALQCPQSTPRWRNYCCWCPQEPVIQSQPFTSLPSGFIHHQMIAMRSRFLRKFCMTHLNVLIRHTNVVRIGVEILRCCHHRKLNSPFISKGLICPFSYRSDFFHRGNAIVRNKHLDFHTVISFGFPNRRFSTYRSDDCVTIMIGNKVLHRPRSRHFKMIAADEMGCEVKPG